MSLNFLSPLLCIILVSATLFGQKENYVRVEYRTLGWGVQAQLTTAETNDPINVARSQFSDRKAYYGPPILKFYPANTRDSALSDESSSPETSLLGNIDSLTKTAGAKQPVAIATIPQGLKQVLFIFINSNQKNGPRYKVAAVNDAKTILDSRNAHFYNLSATDLVIKAFGDARAVKAGGQTIWQLSDDEKVSPLAIAVTNPEARIIYSSRFRVREGQRLIFIATKTGEHPNGTPIIQVASLMETTRAPITFDIEDENL